MKFFKSLAAAALCALLCGCTAVPRYQSEVDIYDYYPPALATTAAAYANRLSIEQQIAQLFFYRFPGEAEAERLISQYAVGGFILFGGDFKNETPDSICDMLGRLQQLSAVPLLIGADEEGGSVVRVSYYPAFRSSRFLSPQEAYSTGGFPFIAEQTAEMDSLLLSLGINVNLGPVADVSQSQQDFIYNRTLGLGAEETSRYVSLVVSQMDSDGIGSALKHFPGYGGSADTHYGIAYDSRPYSAFKESDLLPFIAGIAAGADSVMVAHSIVECIDAEFPASLSAEVHRLLREQLGFGGVIMTDDLAMQAITRFTGGENAAVMAIKAGNDLIITSDFVTQYNAILSAVKNGDISESLIFSACTRVIQWKMDLGLIAADLPAGQ